MINLLPPAERRALKREYRIRVATVFLAFILAFEFLLAAMMVPAGYALRLSTADLTRQLEATRTLVQPDIDDFDRQVNELKSDIHLLSEGKDEGILRYIDALAAAKPATVSVSGISFTREPEPMLEIKGFAPTRADLTQFRANLRKDTTNFLGADFDPKYLLREPIDFSGMRIQLAL